MCSFAWCELSNRCRHSAGSGDALDGRRSLKRKQDQPLARTIARTLRLKRGPAIAGVASEVLTGEPPVSAIRFSFSSAKKAMFFESGDQKGKMAPSVLSSFCAANVPRLEPRSRGSSNWNQGATIGQKGYVAPIGRDSELRAVRCVKGLACSLGRLQGNRTASGGRVTGLRGRMSRPESGEASTATAATPQATWLRMRWWLSMWGRR